MSPLLVGTSGFTDPDRDFAALDLVELHLGRSKMPSLRDAQRWRSLAPDTFSFLLRADVDLREPVGSPTMSRSWKQVIELARALDAALLTVPTPAGLRPTDDHRRLVEAFFPWAHRSGVPLGWEPRCDMWPDDVLAELCREFTLTHVVDPLRRAPARGRPPCYRLNGLCGNGREYTDDELHRARERIDACGAGHPMYDDDRVYVIFGNASRRSDACRLRDLGRDDGRPTR